MMIQRILIAGLTVASALLATPVWAENSSRFGEFTVHHSAFTSDTLNTDVARAYGIQRSKHRGLLNVSVIKEEPGTTGLSVPAQVEVDIVNLAGQRSPIPMREIKDKEATYYIGEFPVYDQQSINFEIQARPQGASETYEVKMSQQFFTD
jgi:hypothetical protein